MMGMIKTQIGAQWAIGRNLQEPIGRRLIRMLLAVLYLSKAIVCGIRSVRREQLGSTVFYRGEKCFVSNWAGSAYPSLKSETNYYRSAPREKITSVLNAKETWHRFTFGARFYLTSWHRIDVQNRLYSLLKSGPS